MCDDFFAKILRSNEWQCTDREYMCAKKSVVR